MFPFGHAGKVLLLVAEVMFPTVTVLFTVLLLVLLSCPWVCPAKVTTNKMPCIRFLAAIVDGLFCPVCRQQPAQQRGCTAALRRPPPRSVRACVAGWYIRILCIVQVNLTHVTY